MYAPLSRSLLGLYPLGVVEVTVTAYWCTLEFLESLRSPDC